MYGCHSDAMARLISTKAKNQNASDVTAVKTSATFVDKYVIASVSKENDLSEPATKQKSSSVMQSLFRGPYHHWATAAVIPIIIAY